MLGVVTLPSGWHMTLCGAAESTVKQRELWKEAETTARAKSLEQGVKFIEVDKKAFAEKTRPMYEKQPPEVKAFIEKIREVE